MRLRYHNSIVWFLIVICLSCQVRESELTHSPLKLQLLSNDEPVLLTDVTDGATEGSFNIHLSWYPRRPGEVTIQRTESGSSNSDQHTVLHRGDATHGEITDTYSLPRTSVLNEKNLMKKRTLTYHFTFTDAQTREEMKYDATVETPRNCLVTKSRPFTLPSNEYWSCRHLKLEEGSLLAVDEKSHDLILESIEIVGGKAFLDLSKAKYLYLAAARGKGELAIVSPPTAMAQINVEIYRPDAFTFSGLEFAAGAPEIKSDGPSGYYFFRNGRQITQGCSQGQLTTNVGEVYRAETFTFNSKENSRIKTLSNQYYVVNHRGDLVQVTNENQQLRHSLDDIVPRRMTACGPRPNGFYIDSPFGRTNASLAAPDELPEDAPFAQLSALFHRMMDLDSAFRPRGIYPRFEPGFSILVTKLQLQFLTQMIKYRTEVEHILKLRQILWIEPDGMLSASAPYYSYNTLHVPPYIVREKPGPFMELLKE